MQMKMILLLLVTLVVGTNSAMDNCALVKEALFEAVHKNDVGMVEYYLQLKAEYLQLRDKDGDTLLSNAAASNSVDVIKLLVGIYKVDVDEVSAHENYTALHWASEWGCAEASKALLAYGADHRKVTTEKHTSLHLAAKYCRVAVAKILLDNNAEVDSVDELGNTPLHLGCYYNAERYRGRIKDGEGLVEVFLASGADINKRSKYGCTPYSTQFKNVLNCTPLQIAVDRGSQNVNLVKYLLFKGADFTVQDAQGRTAYQLAFDDEITHMLQNEGTVKKAIQCYQPK